MGSPPFRFAGALLAGEPVARSILGTRDLLCCAEPSQHEDSPGSRRAKLTELDTNFHCSLIGTCLSTAELRKLVPRFVDVDRLRASDLDLHHEAVQLAFDAGAGAKAIHKALDQRYESHIKRLQPCKDAQTLRSFWAESLKSGDVPGAYWALMTHSHVTAELRKLAFGDVHMLSHLVGAANRADIRRLQVLEQDNAALAERLERQQERLQQLTAERDAQALQLLEQSAQRAAAGDTDAERRLLAQAEIHQVLRTDLEAREQALAHQTHRREMAETGLIEQQNAGRLMQVHLDQALGLVDSLQAELQAVEVELATRFEPSDAGGSLQPALLNKRVVYVGGRPRSNQTIRAIVEAAGGELIQHDGGLEDRKGLLAATLPRADMVVFPVDCIDHDSAASLKRIADKHQIPYYPLRTASAASFSALVARLADAATATRHGPISRFCLRHG